MKKTKTKYDIEVGQLVEFTGIYNQKLCNTKLKGIVTGFHKSGRVFILTPSGFRWMLPHHYLTIIDKTHGVNV